MSQKYKRRRSTVNTIHDALTQIAMEQARQQAQQRSVRTIHTKLNPMQRDIFEAWRDRNLVSTPEEFMEEFVRVQQLDNAALRAEWEGLN